MFDAGRIHTEDTNRCGRTLPGPCPLAANCPRVPRARRSNASWQKRRLAQWSAELNFPGSISCLCLLLLLLFLLILILILILIFLLSPPNSPDFNQLFIPATLYLSGSGTALS